MLLFDQDRALMGRYTRGEDDLEGALDEGAGGEESGWKLVHGDVFRPPRHSELLSALIGTGAPPHSLPPLPSFDLPCRMWALLLAEPSRFLLSYYRICQSWLFKFLLHPGGFLCCADLQQLNHHVAVDEFQPDCSQTQLCAGICRYCHKWTRSLVE